MAELPEKNKPFGKVGVEFDRDEMDGFRVRNRVCSLSPLVVVYWMPLRRVRMSLHMAPMYVT